jgi:hypothetical protein
LAELGHFVLVNELCLIEKAQGGGFDEIRKRPVVGVSRRLDSPVFLLA